MMKRSGFRLALALISAGLWASCMSPKTVPTPALAGDPSLAVWDRLYFGGNIPAGGEVSEADWAAFLAEVVTPRFPHGLTVLRGEGQWRGESGKIDHERNFILEVTHPDTEAANRAVQEIADEYKRRFKQEAVLRIRQHVDARLSACDQIQRAASSTRIRASCCSVASGMWPS